MKSKKLKPAEPGNLLYYPLAVSFRTSFLKFEHWPLRQFPFSQLGAGNHNQCKETRYGLSQ
jgi:hypothetical protein